MRHRSLFAAFRGKDGRSLGRALIVLVLISLFSGGLSIGAAAAGDGATLCSVDAAGDAPGKPQPHEPHCCLPASTPFGLALASVPPAAMAPDYARAAEPLPHLALSLRGAEPLRATARGPPLAA